MAQEYWELIQTRGVATVTVWAMAPAYSLADCDFAGHSARVAGLATLAGALAGTNGTLSDARAACRAVLAQVRELNVRVAAVLDSGLAESDNLRAQLGPIYAIADAASSARAQLRARLVHALWVDFNTQRAAAIPPEPPLTLPYQRKNSEVPPVTVTAADFHTLATATLPDAVDAREEALRGLRLAKTALRSAARRVDRDNKRWYKGWTKYYPKDTPEGDAVRSMVPTVRGTLAPQPLEIASLKAHADRTVTVRFAPKGGRHATTLALLQRVGETGEFGPGVPVERPTQKAGPFAPGETVTFITRASNSRKKNVSSEPKTVVVGSTGPAADPLQMEIGL